MLLSTSIGVAVSAAGRHTGEELLRRADVAMYVAKGRGKARYEVYEPAMQVSTVDDLAMANDLQRAIERHEFVVHYQPVVALNTGLVIGAEALIRWHPPGRGWIPPSRFIPLAEEMGLVLPLGRWVLHEACMQLRRWQSSHPHDPPLTMSVNVSPRQVHQPGLVEAVAHALSQSGIPHSSLLLEITENVLMRDAEAAIVRLQELKELGVRLAIDDFGTGFSSLSYLHRFPIDVLKIDRSFVSGAGGLDSQPGLTKAIVELGQTLNLTVVAEGIESPGQLAALRELGCEFGQGFLFSRPRPADELETLLGHSFVPLSLGRAWQSHLAARALP